MSAHTSRSARSVLCAFLLAIWLAACGGGGGDAPAPVEVNRAPQITTTPVTTATAGGAYAYAANATDPEGDALSYTLTQAPSGMTIDAATGLISWSPSPAQHGNHAVTVSVADRSGLVATQTFSVAVTAANAAPRITTTPPAAAVVGSIFRHDVDATDANGDALTYSLVQAPQGMTIDASSGVIAWAPTASQAGSHAASVRVADPGGLSATQDFAITVAIGNAAPQVTSAPVTAAVVGAPYTYVVRGVDPNGDSLAWSLTQAPAGMAIDAAAGVLAWTPTSAQVGSQTVTVRVADPAGLVATQTFAVAVTVANAAPRITSTPVTSATAGLPFSYVATATDPNGDTLTYSLTNAPAGMTINASSGLVTWTPAHPGMQSVVLRVADPAGLAATQSFSIAVAAPNVAPQIRSTPATTALVNSAYRYDVDADDANGDALTYSLTQAPSGMTIHATSGLIDWTPSASQTGSRAVSVRVADPAGLAATQTFSVVVAVPNVAPSISTTPVVTASIGATYGYDVDAADPNGDSLTYLLTQSPAGMAIDASTGVISWTPTYAQVGRVAVSVRVVDPAGLAATQSFEVFVHGDPRVDMATPASLAADAGGTATITLNWVRMPMSLNTLQFMHLVGAGGQVWSVDDHWTTSATWSAGVFSETRTISVPPGLPSGSYDIRVGLSGGSPWGNLALATGAGVTDPANDRRYRVGLLTVTGRAPQITTTAATIAAASVAYVYDVDAADPNGDPITYSLAQAPTGMTINATTGLIAWTPSPAQLGAHSVVVRAVDSSGLAATQTFTLNVSAEPAMGPMRMACPDGAGWQCSGDVLLRTDNGIALSRSGVQAYGRSTSDLGTANPNPSTAFGLAPASGGLAEIRVRKDGNSVPAEAAVLLSNLGIHWSGQVNRPQIIETFSPTAGRVFLDASGALKFGSLPSSSDLSYYDYATLGAAGTRLNYANNRYFPRAEPARCVAGGVCLTTETPGPQFTTGSWRFGGTEPDRAMATRNHEDGDVHAGNGLPDANGNPTWLPGGTGFGVPMPGSKGYRTLDQRSYQFANLAAWFTEDTVDISEWGGSNEHNKNRRGFVAFGDTTDPLAVPTSGTATYVGVVHGRSAANGIAEPVQFTGVATAIVNFASRTVTVSIQNTGVDLTAVTQLASGANANYMTGAAANASLAGGLSARFFGPVAGGGNGAGPAEIGGVFSLANAGTGAISIGGFIARKQ